MNPEKVHHFGSPEFIASHTISVNATIREALAALNKLSGESMTLFVVTDQRKLAGTLTDGDIRRAIIAGAGIDSTLENVMHRNFLYATPGSEIFEAMALGRKRKVALLPVVNDGVLTGIIDLNKTKTFLPVDAVLMAGGRGERLRPLTDTVPKPLLPVGGKPIIDYNIEELEACGVDNIYVTVNYMAEKIENHIASYKGQSRIHCVKEPKRLGTMGSISLIRDFEKDDIILMNSDLLTTIDFEGLFMRHKHSGADLTMASVPYSVSVPFAVMQMDDDRVTGLEEKPTFNYFANAGVYIIRRELLERIIPGEYLDAPDFITSLIDDGGNVVCYPIDGTWIDIGSTDDYRHANDLMQRRNKTL